MDLRAIIVFCYVCSSYASKVDLKLELLQVMFRHGDRLPSRSEIYPTDPYEPEQYEALGYNQLLKAGMLRTHKFGQVLRKRYDSFLGTYRFNKVYAFSTDTDRTKLSLLSLLSGLYPLEKTFLNNETISLAPVPIYYNRTEENILLKNTEGYCPRYETLLEKAGQLPEILNKYKKYAKFWENLKNITGEKRDMNVGGPALYNNMKSLSSMKLPRPDWCTQNVFENLHKITAIVYETMALTESLKRIISGPIIEQFLHNIKISNAKSDDGKKIYLYSGHDHALGALTKAHKFKKAPVVPGFADGLIVEKLRGKNNRVYLQMFYWKGIDEELVPLNFRRIGNKISLEMYNALVSPLLPRDGDCI